MDEERFIKELEILGISINDKQLWQLNRYYELLCEWNEKINLTRIIEKNNVYLKHFYDSLTLSKAIDLHQEMSLCDVGTGAGFPGIVLKIVFPTLSITLIDSLLKRINFLNIVINELKLDKINTVHARGEDYARMNREKFDIVTSRAVANLSLLSEISIPMLKEKGFFIPMKANIDSELLESKDILNKLSSEVIDVIEFNLPIENSHRTIIKIQKMAKTNVKYPRSFDKMKKKR